MRSNIDLQFANDAEADIDDILQYTYETWGGEQEVTYREVLRQAFLRARDFPEFGRPSPTAPHERELILKHHVIVNRYERDTVTILRVLSHKQRRNRR